MLEDMITVLSLSWKLKLNPKDVLVIKDYLDTKPTDGQMLHDFHNDKDLWSVVQRLTNQMMDGRLLRYYQRERENILEEMNKTENALRSADSALQASERLNYLVTKDEALMDLQADLRKKVELLNENVAELKKMVVEVDKILQSVREAMSLSQRDMN